MHALPPRRSCMCGLVERARHKEKRLPARNPFPCANALSVYLFERGRTEHVCFVPRISRAILRRCTVHDSLTFFRTNLHASNAFSSKGLLEFGLSGSVHRGGVDSRGIFSSRHARGEPGVARIVRPCGTTCLFSYLTPVRGHKNGRHLRCSSRFLQMRRLQRRFQRVVALH